MNTKMTINRLRTGVPGLDEVLGGGLPEFSFNLITGPPGCGKKTLAHHMMFALATPERPALYFIVLGEPPLKMLRYQQQFEFFDNEAVTRSIRYITDLRFSPYGMAFSTDTIIVQRCIEIESRLLRVMAEEKVRASDYSDELRLYQIDDYGIRISKMLVEQEGLLGGRPTQKNNQMPLPQFETDELGALS